MKKPKTKILYNNAYAVKTVWNISKSRVIHSALNIAGDYFEWIFFSIFFVRYLINAIINEAAFSTIMFYVGICFVVFCTKSLYDSYYQAFILPFTENKVYRTLHGKIYAKARNVELRCYEDADFYSRYTMAMENSADKMDASVRCFLAIIFGITAEIVAFASIYSIDPYAVLFVIFPVIGNMVFGNIMGRIFNTQYTENVKHKRVVGYVNRVMYLAEFAKEVRYSNIHKVMKKRLEDAVVGIRSTYDRHAKRVIIFGTIQSVLSYTIIFEGIMLYAAYRAIISQTMNLAELAIMFSAMVPCSWILVGLSENIREAFRNGQFLEHFRGFMEYKEAIPEDQDGILPERNITSIEFKDVSFAYKEGLPLINGLSFKITGGQKVALVGHNGAGKTTIMKLLFRLYDPTDGEILVNGINIKEYNLKAYRNLFATAFQDYRIMSMSIRDNVLMGEDGTETMVEEALRQAGILEKVQTLPNGIDTVLTREFDENGAVFSGGQIQKVIVARAFARNCPIKVYDEPSSALDPIAEYELYQGIMKQSRDNDITIFISHRLSTVKDADFVYMLENGAIIEQGTHAELVEKGGAYHGMYIMQAQNYLADEHYQEGQKGEYHEAKL